MRSLWVLVACIPLLAQANVVPRSMSPCPSPWPTYHAEYLNAERQRNGPVSDSPTESYMFELETEEAEDGYSKGEQHVFSLRSDPDYDHIRGFIIAATALDQTNGCGFGSFEDNFPAVKPKSECPNVLLNADFDRKTLVSFAWKAPTCGCVQIRASIITDVDEYYIDDDEVLDGPLTQVICPDEDDEDDEDDMVDFINNTLFPLGDYDEEDDDDEENNLLDVVDMQFYGEEQTEDMDDLDDDMDDIQDELELEFGVPVSDDDDEDDDVDDVSEEMVDGSTDGVDEFPVDEDLASRRKAWLEKHMKGNGKSWKENIKKFKKKKMRKQGAGEQEEVEDDDEDEAVDAAPRPGRRERKMQKKQERKQRKQERKQNKARRGEGVDDDDEDMSRENMEASQEQGRGRGTMGRKRGMMGRGRGMMRQREGSEEREDDPMARITRLRKELAAQRTADLADVTLTPRELRARQADRKRKLGEILKEYRRLEQGARSQEEEEEGRPGHRGDDKRGHRGHRKPPMSPAVWEDMICKKLEDPESQRWQQLAAQRSMDREEREMWAKKQEWIARMKECCEQKGEERRECFRKIYQEKVDRICRLEEPFSSKMSDEVQEDMLDECCAMEGEMRLRCFEEKKRRHSHGHHRGSRHHHRRHHHHHPNGSMEATLCRRLKAPFTPGKFKRHLLTDMEGDDGEAWRAVWERRREELAECCGLDIEKRAKCLKDVRNQRWDRVCDLEEPLPHWHYSGQERTEVMATCCEAQGEERFSCFNNTVDEKHKDMTLRKWRAYKEKLSHNIKEKAGQVCQRLESQENPRAKMVAKVNPKRRNQLQTIWHRRKEEMLQCCTVDGFDRMSCLEDMRADRYDRICEGEEPVSLHSMANRRKAKRESPLVHSCCQLEDEERYNCFNETVVLRNFTGKAKVVKEVKADTDEDGSDDEDESIEDLEVPSRKGDRKSRRRDQATAKFQARRQRVVACCNVGRPSGKSVDAMSQSWRVCSRAAKSYMEENPLEGAKGRLCEHHYRRCCKNSAYSRLSAEVIEMVEEELMD